MVQASDKQSRKTDVEARERLVEYALKKIEHPIYRGKFWCSERKDYFNYIDWLYK
jgi:hypothetical protein